MGVTCIRFNIFMNTVLCLWYIRFSRIDSVLLNTFVLASRLRANSPERESHWLGLRHPNCGWECPAQIPTSWKITFYVFHRVFTQALQANITAVMTSRGPKPMAVLPKVKPLDCWDSEFESRWGHERSSPVFDVCCVGSGLCDELGTRSEKSQGMRVSVCELETSTMRQPRPDLGFGAPRNLQTWYKLFLPGSIMHDHPKANCMLAKQVNL
jgi:hypothetical protein